MGLFGISLRAPVGTLVLLHWHFMQILLSGFNWRFFVSQETTLVGDNVSQIHIAFVIIGIFVYILVASVIIYWPYRYGEMMLAKHRRNRLFIGTALIYFFHVLPIWIIEFSIAWNYGWLSLVQGVAIVFVTISWVLETLGVWYSYMWYMSSFMHNNYANTAFGRGGL